MTSQLVRYDRQDLVATISMNGGRANALSQVMLSAIAHALDQAQADEAAVVLTGTDGCFSAGFDLKTLSGRGPEAVTMLRSGFRLAHRLLSFPTPVVIACSGHAIAMGLFLALSGDYRIGARGPHILTANEVALGLPVPLAAIEICRYRVPPPHFDRVVTLAERYTPDSAVTAGILDQVVESTDLIAAAAAVATNLAKLDRSAYIGTKLRARANALAAVRAGLDNEFGTSSFPENLPHLTN
ncbi:crotonase/enoyl-CoA hydratase family protein [Kribbella sp. NBC_01505]|uniref:crotonase/enoyl-CoA hydratase family protein n=1 Tax=Kribbella sp. NBC_01505 TaxID=2903580 RepID=UPI00386FC717